METAKGESQQTLFELPSELLEHIWSDNVLNHEDVCRLSCVCKKFREISSSNEVWRCKLMQRWPKLFPKYPRRCYFSWITEYKLRYQYKDFVQKKIKGMSALYFNKEEVPKDGFADLSEKLKEHENAPKFIIDELVDIVEDDDRYLNLTEKYYAQKALRHIQQIYLTKEWQEFLALPPHQQTLEKGAVMISQWCQPHCDITFNGISDQLDLISNEVRKHLKVKYPNYPACKPLPCADHSEVHENLWPSAQCRDVLECLNYVLFVQMGYTGNQEDYYDPKNSFINQVLEKRTGIPIALSVVYIAVARRLGVVCVPVNFPMHFLIKFKEHPHLHDGMEFTYIDVFNKGKFLSETECHRILEVPLMSISSLQRESFSAIPPKKVFERMSRNLVNTGRQQGQMGDGLISLRTAVELFIVICPEDVEFKLLLARLYLHLNINPMEVIKILQPMSAADGSAPTGLISYLTHVAQKQMEEEKSSNALDSIKPKRRADHPEVAYGVGMIMSHKRYNYTCVVYGWDPECVASQEWITQMGVHMLPRKHKQPFYNVLVNDGSNRYAAQENLEIANDPKEIKHPEIGRYFSEMCQRYYKANAEKCQQYPDDQALCMLLTEEENGMED